MKIDMSLTQAENASLNNCTRQTIAKYCKENNLKLKDGRGKRSNVTINPFIIDGHYWLGYFLGDGIYSKKNIGICSKDFQIVNDFHNCCNNSNKIYSQLYKVEDHTRHIYKSMFGNEKVYNYLENVGVSFTNKTTQSNLNIPITWDIVRGLFDSDGSVAKNEFKITTSNPYIKEQLIEFFKDNWFKIRLSEKNNSWDIVVRREYKESRDSQYPRLYALLYFNCRYFLLRKRIQFAAIIGDNYMKTGLIAGTSLESN